MELAELLSRITDDIKTIARDEVALVRDELAHSARSAARDSAIMLIGGFVGLIGLAMLCLAGVAALAPVIPALWARLLIGAAVYLIAGSAVAAGFGARLVGDTPQLGVAGYEAKRTFAGIAETLSRKEKHTHA